jgi:hypothetical protein
LAVSGERRGAELTVEMTDSDGHLVPWNCRDLRALAPAGRELYVLLDSGQFVGVTWTNLCLEMISGRRYRLVVRFRNSGNPEGLFPGRVLDGELASSPVEVLAP